MDIKIHKTVRFKATVIGLEVTSFFIFAIICVCAVLFLINSFTFINFLVIGVIVGIIYILLLFFQGNNIIDILSKLPKIIVNK